MYKISDIDKNKICIKNLPLDIQDTEIRNIFKDMKIIEINKPSDENRRLKCKTTQTAFVKFSCGDNYCEALDILEEGVCIRGYELTFESPRVQDIIRKTKIIRGDRPEDKVRQFRDLMNKLSDVTYSKLSKQIIECVVSIINDIYLLECVELLHSKMISEKFFIDLYSNICKELFVDNKFKKMFLNLCQKTFESKIDVMNVETITYYRMRKEGNLILIATLYNKDIIKCILIDRCFSEMLSSYSQNIENICILANTLNVNKFLEFVISVELIDILKKSRDTMKSCKLKFQITDLVEKIDKADIKINDNDMVIKLFVERIVDDELIKQVIVEKPLEEKKVDSVEIKVAEKRIELVSEKKIELITEKKIELVAEKKIKFDEKKMSQKKTEDENIIIPKKIEEKKFSRVINHKYKFRVIDLSYDVNVKDIIYYFKGCGHLDINIVKERRTSYADIGFSSLDCYNLALSRDSGKIKGKTINISLI